MTIRALAFVAVIAGMAAQAEAAPLLQLDILGGYYDSTTNTIISSSNNFILVAVFQPLDGSSPPIETFYISAAVYPTVGPADAPIGSFTWNGTPYNVTDDMVYGTPPLELVNPGADPGDFPNHIPGVFPTYFTEFAFQFSPAQRTVQYDSAVNPGGLLPTSAFTGIGYFQLFNITTALASPSLLHFDLYAEIIHLCGHSTMPCIDDIDVSTSLAADTHDAQSDEVPVPEPGSALLIGLGAVGAAGRSIRRCRAARA